MRAQFDSGPLTALQCVKLLQEQKQVSNEWTSSIGLSCSWMEGNLHMAWQHWVELHLDGTLHIAWQHWVELLLDGGHPAHGMAVLG